MKNQFRSKAFRCRFVVRAFLSSTSSDEDRNVLATGSRWRQVMGMAMLAIGLFSVIAFAAPPRVGYVYPAGGQWGTTFEVEIGGQYLKDPTGVLVSGGGVTGEILDHNKLPAAQVVSDFRDRLDGLRGDFQGLEQGRDVPTSEVMPELVRLLDSVEMTEKDVRQVDEYTMRRQDLKRQLNDQISETVTVRLRIERDVVPGQRFLRLQTEAGLSNPIRFVIGEHPEYREPRVWNFHLPTYLGVETTPERSQDSTILSERKTFLPPATINGRTLPGEVDEYSFEAEEGDQLVVSVAARGLVPYLADAVPGWFQAVVSLEDPRGRELAFSDDYRFNPDPVLFYKIPRSGKYRMKIHDSIYRGREDFVYRITIGELPFLTGISPLGGQAGGEVNLTFQGGNLTERERPRFPLPDLPGLIKVEASGLVYMSNAISFLVDDVPEDSEREENDRIGAANVIAMPGVVNGSIGSRGDKDFFRVNGKGNQPMTFEVFARRLGSPLDSNLTVFDDDGNQIGWNDDFENPSAGLTTHHADARLTVTLPDNGQCFVRVAETQNKGGVAYAYRLKVTQGVPDVALRVTPASVTTAPGGTAALTVHVLRLDDFKGSMRLELKDPPEGYVLKTVTIPGDADTLRVAISVPTMATEIPQSLELVAHATTEEGKEFTFPVVPSEDMTQAFITKHIVPVDALLIDIREPPAKPVAAAP